MKKIFKAVLVYIPAGMMFVVALYLLESLHDAGRQVFDEINQKGIGQLHWPDVAVICYALFVAMFLVYVYQILKSLWEATFKKGCEEIASKVVAWIEK